MIFYGKLCNLLEDLRHHIAKHLKEILYGLFGMVIYRPVVFQGFLSVH